MSTWTCKRIAGRGLRPAFGVFVVLSLSGCLGGAGGAGVLSGKATAAAPRAEASRGKISRGQVLPRAELAGGSVVVRAPQGYCIDADSLSDKMGRGFVLIAACGALDPSRGTGVARAVMTVSVTEGRKGAEQPDAQVLAGVLGDMGLARSIDGDGLTLAHLETGGDTHLPGADRQHWRGVMLVNGRIVGIALYGPKGHAVAGAAGRGLLVQLAEEIREASPTRLPVALVQGGGALPRPEPALAPPKTDASGGKSKKNLLRRLFH